MKDGPGKNLGQFVLALSKKALGRNAGAEFEPFFERKPEEGKLGSTREGIA